MANFEQVLPVQMFNAFDQIVRDWAATDPSHICLSEEHLSAEYLSTENSSAEHLTTGLNPGVSPWYRFTLVTKDAQILLLRAAATASPQQYRIGLTVSLAEISNFIQGLQLLWAAPSKRLWESLTHSKSLKKFVKAGLDPTAQPPVVSTTLPAELVWPLLAAVSQNVAELPLAAPLSCPPFVSDIVRQVEQERLLHQVVSQIRQSLELPEILTTAIGQGRSFLGVDRLLLVQFNLPQPAESPSQTKASSQAKASSPTKIPSQTKTVTGQVCYEALATPQISSVLAAAPDYLLSAQDYQAHQQGQSVEIVDILTDYRPSPKILAQRRQAAVQTSLSTPIRVQGQLWGLLIAHQCQPLPASAPEPIPALATISPWQNGEPAFLAQMAEHLAVAIQQAQLSSQLQLQAQTTEQRVGERTQALQTALVATQSANRTKSDFLATMSHELRTPLTCVIGMSATLLRWSLGPLNDKQRSYLKTIHDSGEHLLELINDILDLSQVEAGKATLSLSEFSLSQLGRQCLQAMREKAIAAGVELKADILTQGRDTFVADQRRCRQILFNLLSNAIKFTPAGGQVTLRVWLENKSALLQVEDTGIGIPPEKKSLLFQKFQQLDASYRRSYEGMGLGLALTKQLVDMHHGWIEVESTEDKGSVFTVELPIQQFPDELKNMRNPEAPMAGRIALIEDNEETATLICELLTAAGFQVIWMIEPSTAVEQVQLLQPLAAIISAQLASIDGYEMIRRLRLHPPEHPIKILLLTPTVNAEQRQQYHHSSADAYLNVPIKPEHLLQKMTQLLALELAPLPSV
jgi:two-component system, sensor histidine kinase and response regulator